MSAMHVDHNDPEILQLDLGIEGVTLARLIEAQEYFLGVIREVTASVVGDRAGIRWAVARIDTGSLDLFLRAEPARESIPRSLMAETVGAVATGFRSLEHHATRPPHFNDAALRHADSLAKLGGHGISKIHVKTARTETAMTPRTTANVAEIVGQTIDATGSIEGRLEAMNVHGGDRVFYVWDPITNAKVRCEFGRRIRADEVGRAVEHRVVVTGTIRYHEDRSIRDVRATELRILEDAADLPSADDVLGILAPT